MGTFMLGRFHTLVVTSSFLARTENILFDWKKRTGGVLWTRDVDTARAFINTGCAKNITTLVIGAVSYDEDLAAEYIADFVRGCPRVTSLSVSDEHVLWAQKYEHALRSVEIITERPGMLPELCYGTRELCLTMRSPEFTDSYFWPLVGPSLEILKLRWILKPRDGIDLGSIQIHCRKIRHLELRGKDDQNEELVRLYVSYKKQLTYCKVVDMNHGELRTIRNSCPNASIDATVNKDDLLIPTLEALGSRLHCLHFNSDSGLCSIQDVDSLGLAWNKCTELTELYLKHCSKKVAEAISMHPKRNIEILELGTINHMTKSDLVEMLKFIQIGMGPLESYGFRGSLWEAPFLSKIISKNRATLRDVSIYISHSSSCADPFLVLNLLKDCPLLESVTAKRFSRHVVIPLARQGVVCHGTQRKYYYENDEGRPHWSCVLCVLGSSVSGTDTLSSK